MAPIIIKGMFIITIQMYNGQGVISAISIEIPVTPPSINPFGIRNASRPNDAELIPRRIKNIPLTYLKILEFVFINVSDYLADKVK
jgi:hypothetical protein